MDQARAAALSPPAPPRPPAAQDGWAVGGALSVADTFLFDLIDFHLAKFGADKLTQARMQRRHRGAVAGAVSGSQLAHQNSLSTAAALCARPTQAYPALMAHHAKIAALPGVAAYLAGPLRHAK